MTRYAAKYGSSSFEFDGTITKGGAELQVRPDPMTRMFRLARDRYARSFALTVRNDLNLADIDPVRGGEVGSHELSASLWAQSVLLHRETGKLTKAAGLADHLSVYVVVDAFTGTHSPMLRDRGVSREAVVQAVRALKMGSRWNGFSIEEQGLHVAAFSESFDQSFVQMNTWGAITELLSCEDKRLHELLQLMEIGLKLRRGFSAVLEPLDHLLSEVKESTEEYPRLANSIDLNSLDASLAEALKQIRQSPIHQAEQVKELTAYSETYMDDIPTLAKLLQFL